jgi:hypothetical protein
MFKTALRWLVRVVPPLLLLPLVVIPPWDQLIFIFWLIGALAMLVSSWRIVYQIGRKCWASIFSRECNLDGKALLRPFVTVGVMVIAFTSLSVSWRSARTYILKVAEQVQSTCIKSGECPGDMPGWTRDGSKYVSLAGSLMSFPVYYYPMEDQKAFKVLVRWNYESHFEVTGGVNSQLKSEEISS